MLGTMWKFGISRCQPVFTSLWAANRTLTSLFALKSKWSLILLMSAGLQSAAKLKRKSLTEVMKERALLLHSQMVNIFYSKSKQPQKFYICIMCIGSNWSPGNMRCSHTYCDWAWSYNTKYFNYLFIIFSGKQHFQWNTNIKLEHALLSPLSHILSNRYFICLGIFFC